MNMQRVHQLRQSIDAEQRKLEEAMKAVVVQPCVDDNELASHYENTHTGIVLVQRARERLLYLSRRMESIKNWPDALCADCGEAIAPQRLAALPDAMRCAPCQEDWEKEQHMLPLRHDADSAIPQYA